MSIILFIIICGLIFSLGLWCAVCLGFDQPLEWWGLGWLLGMGWGSFFWFLAYYWFNIPFTLVSLITMLLILNVLGWFTLFNVRKKWLTSLFLNTASNFNWLSLKTSWAQQSSITQVGIVLLTLFSLFIFWQDIFWPVTDWDALALYDFRAKVMVRTGTLAQGKELEYFFQYPLFTSLFHTWTYLTGLGIAKVWYAIMYQATIVTFYVALRYRTSPVISMIGTIFLATSPLIFYHSFMAYTNLAFTVYGGLGFIFLWQWWNDGQGRFLLLGAMLIGLSTWIRISEPFYLIAIMLLVIGTIKLYITKQLSKLNIGLVALSGFLILCTRYPWDGLITQLYGANVNTPISSLSLVQTWSLTAFANRTQEVVLYLWQYSVPVYLYYIALALGLLVIDIKHRRWTVLFAWFTIVSLVGLIFVGTLLLSFSLESWNRIGDSVARMSLFLVPLCIYTIFASPSWQLLRKKSTS